MVKPRSKTRVSDVVIETLSAHYWRQNHFVIDKSSQKESLIH